MLKVDTIGRRVWRDGEEIHLTTTEFNLLDVLMARPGVAVPYRTLAQELFRETWRDPKDSRLRTYICHLRNKTGLRITALRGWGFRLDGVE